MDPLTGSLILGGASILSGLLNKKPDAPDLVSPVLGQSRIAQQRFSEDQQRILELLEEQDRAAGRYGSGRAARQQRVYQAGARGAAELRARKADMLAQAANEQERIQAELDQQAFQARGAQIQQGLSALGFLLPDAFGGSAPQTATDVNPPIGSWGFGKTLTTPQSTVPGVQGSMSSLGHQQSLSYPQRLGLLSASNVGVEDLSSIARRLGEKNYR